MKYSTTISALFTTLLLSACAPDLSGFSLAPTASPTESPGGIWSGVDSDGSGVVAFVTESGAIQTIGQSFNQGSGLISVRDGNSVSGLFFVTTEFGLTLPDGTTRADCPMTGTVTERQSMSITFDCTTTAGLQHQTTLTMTYDVLYERDSSLATIAGNYDDGEGNVFNIAANGVVFMQNPETGCVTNGRLGQWTTAFNLYAVEIDISNCTGENAMFNGSSFTGSATLDDTVTPEQFVLSMSGSVAEAGVSISGFYERL